MISICDEAFCVWDKVSKGTKKNIEDLNLAGKKTDIMIHFGAFLSNIKSIDTIYIVDDVRTADINEIREKIEADKNNIKD